MSEGMTNVEWRCLHDDPLPEVELGMSNFDHEVPDGLAEAIADGQHQADYAGWEFHAIAYLGAEGVYVADVHRYHAHVDFITAPSLPELMMAVSDEWGYE